MDNISGINSYNSTYNASSTNALKDKLQNSDLSKATDEELMSVCKDFEGMFVEQLMKSMIKMSRVDGDTDDDNLYSSIFGISDDTDSGMKLMSNYFGDEMLSNVADKITEAQGNNGGLGIAQQLYEQMKRNLE